MEAIQLVSGKHPMPDLEAARNWTLVVRSWDCEPVATSLSGLVLGLTKSGCGLQWKGFHLWASVNSRSNTTSLGRVDFLWRKFWGQGGLEMSLYCVEHRAPHFFIWKRQCDLALSSGQLPTISKRIMYFIGLPARQLETSQNSVLEVSVLHFTAFLWCHNSSVFSSTGKQ